MTKKDLIEHLEKYPDDIKITVGEYNDNLVITETIHCGRVVLKFDKDFSDD